MTISRLPDNVHSIPWQLTVNERKAITCTESSDDAMSCRRTLYLGFFFDGTRNNLHYDEKENAHSNVARLYRAFKEAREQGEDRQYRYAVYVPGVGTEFRKQIGDTGVGLHAAAGAAAGWGGEARINWALLQLQNLLHRYCFDNEPLTGETEDRALVGQMSTDINLKRMQDLRNSTATDLKPKEPRDRQLRGEVSTRQAFQAVASTQWRDTDVDGRRRVLAQRRVELRDKLTPVLNGRLPRVAQIRLSVFGFSRGAAEARVFVNWLRDLCDEATGPLRICGVPAKVDFLGLFDSVASVGAAQGWLEDYATGHGGWAQRRDLRIPGPLVVSRCLHLVAGHEVRGSFPVDAASGPNVEEVVYPGVHSDLGGGYRPGEQGRSVRDEAKLSQIPLCHMYRAALAAGVPLVDLTSAPPGLQDAFRVDTGLIGRFNAYIGQLRTQGSEGADTQALVQLHYRQYLHWRRYRLGQHKNLPAVIASSRQDRTDLILADNELKEEWDMLLRAREVMRARNSTWGSHGYTGFLVDGGLMTLGVMARYWSALLGGTFGFAGAAAFDDLPGGAVAAITPLDTAYWSLDMFVALTKAAESKWTQWTQVENAWNRIGAPPSAACALFEQDVHDSRAWFKPLGDDDDVWADKRRARLKELLKKEKQAERARGVRMLEPAGSLAMAMYPVITERERSELARYRERLTALSASDGQFPDDALPTQPGGREFYILWGYLRWRTVYQDPIEDFRARYPALAQANRDTLKARKKALAREAAKLDERARQIYQGMGNWSGGGGQFGFGGYSYNTQALIEYGAAATRQAEISAEQRAVDAFLEELGPAPWW
ncbi:T6SS phospholipase effector Tle1-like catalytic domain-containing protein [Pseudomonas aeruginosa]